MGPKGVSRREAIVGTIALAARGGRPAVAGGNMAKPSTLPPGNGDGQLIAVNAILRGYGGKAPIGATFYETLGLKKRAAERLAASIPIATGTPAELVRIRARLQANRAVFPLFDTARFTRDFEAALKQAWIESGAGPQQREDVKSGP